ncbi:hypothetical protein WH47_07104 [Habropoda laboriosa]|uniref:Uncharacterized protein n=1 Tax=Habropoda laboriosa TaxID=597456 RepID=A0A0L7QRE1_9HYME|nr:hypothetical protein WH47_07104 [Habropoda laboriosa]
MHERDIFETAIFGTLANVEKFINSSRDTQASAPSPTVSASESIARQVTPQLPTIVLPSFDGNYNDWLRFRDTFESLIHSNSSLSDIQRFHYLNSALRGPAVRAIQSLGVSDVNYKLAWEGLKSRYEDPVSLIHHHTNALLELTSVKRHSSSSLREFIDSAKNHVLALGALGEPVNTWDTLLVLVLSKKN